MDHDDWLELVSAKADGELDASEGERLDAHLDTCPSCTAMLARFERERRRIRLHAAAVDQSLVDAVLAARAGDDRDADRARTVLMRRAAVAVVGVAAAMVALVITVGHQPAPTQVTATDAGDALIAAQDHSFAHADIEVNAGTTVEWHNSGTTTHHLVRDLGGATVDEDLTPGQTESATFERPGTFRFFCTIHPEMSGTVTVDQT